MIPLPIDEVLPALLSALAEHGAVVLEAPPGSGKTTRVPPALASIVRGQVWVLEPRRIAARAAARRVASERGEAVGESVGYAMRFDRKSGPNTRILYVTEALLTRRLDDFPGIDAIVLDEFHERSIHSDVALAWVRALRVRRSALKLVVMSATLDGERIAEWLGCPRVRATGTLFPVDISYQERRDERAIEERVNAAVRATSGDTLVFLPGRGEIERCADKLRDFDVHALYGELEGDIQDRALRGGGGSRRIVLATNVAETSLTVEGIETVIDTGLARVPGHDPWSGLSTLQLQPIARANATQRAGRAGRLAAGRCLRLYSQADHDARPAALPPELLRSDLSALVLALGGASLEWMEPPPSGAWLAAVALLRRLGALDEGGLTEIGERMRGLPVSPRQARVLVEAAAWGFGRAACRMVTMIGGRRGELDPVAETLNGGGDGPDARQLERALSSQVSVRDVGAGARRDAVLEEVLTRSLLAGFPDRVGRREGGRIRFAEGGSAQVEPGRDGFVLVPDAERIGNTVRARAVTTIPADWLVERADVVNEMRWTGERVEVVEELRVGALVLESSPGPGERAAVAELLAENAALRHFSDAERAAAWLARAGYLKRSGIALPDVSERSVIRAGCEGLRSLVELSGAALLDAARALPGVDMALIDRLAPEFVALPGRPRAPVSYDSDQPYVSARMQDFFGLAEGPAIAGGPLVLHLLAPNMRPVQVTRDLSGFWNRHWPGIRKELMRRYPRHYWPEDPLNAAPPPPRPPRTPR